MSEILSLIAVITSIVSAVIIFQQTRLFRQTNMLPILVDMFKEYRSAEFKRHQSYIVTQLSKQCDASETGFSRLPEEASNHVLPVSHFFDNLGVLVANRIVDEKTVLSFMGESIELTWSVLEPYILREREFRQGDYQMFFEYLVVRARAQSPARIRRKLLKRVGSLK